MSIFQPALAVWTTLLAIVTRVEPFPSLTKCRGWAKVLGILLAVCGAVTMVLDKVKDESSTKSEKSTGSQFLGTILALGNTFMTAIYLLLQKRFIFQQPNGIWKSRPVGVTTWAYCFGTIFLGFSSLYNLTKPKTFTEFPSTQVYPLLYAIFITSALCYLLVTWCNMQISSSLVTASWPLQTLLSAVLAYVFLGDALTLTEYLGGALIISGMGAVVWSNYAEERALGQAGVIVEPPAHIFGPSGYSQIPTVEKEA